MVEQVKAAQEQAGLMEEAFSFGYKLGHDFNEATGASTYLADKTVAADPKLMYSASQDWDDAESEWEKGVYGSAVGDGAKAVGKLAYSAGEAAVDAIGDGLSSIGSGIADIFD